MNLSMTETYRLEEAEPTFNLKLIEAVKQNRCLYDTTDRQYRTSDYKARIWHRLVSVLHFAGDYRTLYARWKQLRDKYGKEKRKSKYTNEPSNWQYYKYLSFLDPYMIDRSTQQSPSKTEPVTEGNQRYLQQVAVTDPNWGVSLIEEVKSHPCLFDVRDAKYRHSNCRNVAWKEVIKALNFPGDINSIYKQWKKLRDRYVREKRRIREQRECGIADESSWDLFHSMAWMDPFLDERTQNFKRKHEDAWSDGELDDIRLESGMVYTGIVDKRDGGADVLLDGDSAFAVSDLRTLPENVCAMVKAQIEALLANGINGIIFKLFFNIFFNDLYKCIKLSISIEKMC